MTTLAAGLDYADLQFLGRPQIIAAGILHSVGGVAIVDPGPASSLPVLTAELERRGMSIGDVRSILLTHIHLDHAGATGSLLARNPAIEVFVHERGAPHMIDPSKLLASASRLYGDAMERLWGEFLAVPADRVRVLKGGERVQAGGRELEVAYTPGHAVHHISYLDRGSGVAFAGDVAGIRRGPTSYVMPPTPPPDIDLAAWRESADRLIEWRPATLFVTHFGPYNEVVAQIRQLMDRLEDWASTARSLVVRTDLNDDQRLEVFVKAVRLDLRRHMSESDAESYERAGRLDYSWQGLKRYWTKRLGSPGS
jgi:glyoxylase-like metal-dependent hydrolase (beta-lactamase superfamily II)